MDSFPQSCLKLPKELKPALRRPFGDLIKNDLYKLKPFFRLNPPKIIAVGDFCSMILKKAGVKSDLYIVDNKIERKIIGAVDINAEKSFTVENPPSHITVKAWHTIKIALDSDKPAKITVIGEEDLLAIPAIILAPVGSLVFYGMPSKGMVLVHVSREIKDKCREILRFMTLCKEHR